jgi:SAM-dependent methyltransferase
MNDQNPLGHVRDYWNVKAMGEIDDCARIESGQRAQKMRFENFLLANEVSGKRVLDVGCGVGDFHAHLCAKGIKCEYVGVDLSAAMIGRCRERFEGGTFEVCDILDWEPEQPFDYVVSFAIHNVVVPDGWGILERVTRRQFELCAFAAHVSLLTDRYEGFAGHIQPWRAEEVLALALGITPYVMLQHHYLPNDFSITMYRLPLIDTRTGLCLE